jgi:hypothetical protein
MTEGFLTLRDVMRRTGQPRHIVDYAIDRHGPKHCGRVGITRIWRAEDWPQIEDAIRETHGQVTASQS